MRRTPIAHAFFLRTHHVQASVACLGPVRAGARKEHKRKIVLARPIDVADDAEKGPDAARALEALAGHALRAESALGGTRLHFNFRGAPSWDHGALSDNEHPGRSWCATRRFRVYYQLGRSAELRRASPSMSHSSFFEACTSPPSKNHITWVTCVELQSNTRE